MATGSVARVLRILYVCRSVDESDTYTGVQATWIRALAEHPDVASVHVLTRVVGPSELPANVTLRTFGHGRSQLWREGNERLFGAPGGEAVDELRHPHES